MDATHVTVLDPPPTHGVAGHTLAVESKKTLSLAPCTSVITTEKVRDVVDHVSSADVKETVKPSMCASGVSVENFVSPTPTFGSIDDSMTSVSERSHVSEGGTDEIDEYIVGKLRAMSGIDLKKWLKENNVPD
eukprot:jgi/Bigna1/136281/aug1.33_g10989